jgi:hypothetical protein
LGQIVQPPPAHTNKGPHHIFVIQINAHVCVMCTRGIIRRHLSWYHKALFFYVTVH